MGKNTKILWCDSSWNPWIGCKQISPGCDNCYAKAQANHWYPNDKLWDGNLHQTSERYWLAPLAWNKQAASKPMTVFCGSMCDIMQDDPQLENIRPLLWQLISKTPNLIWLLLTKRSQNYHWMFPGAWYKDWPANVWLGATVENQYYTRRANDLVYMARRYGCKTFISAEPLLGQVDLTKCRQPGQMETFDAISADMINWVIAGGESGTQARPMHLAWVRLLQEQCKAANVPFFFKQWGQWNYTDNPGNAKGDNIHLVGDGKYQVKVKDKHDAGDTLDGLQYHQFPAEFRK